MRTHRHITAAALSMLLAFIACNVPGKTAEPSPVAITPTPLSDATGTAALSSGGTPAATPASDEAIPISDPEKIVFETGATSVTLQGSVAENGISTYLLYALEGQTMTVEVAASGGRVALTIVTPNGIPLVRSMLGQTEWRDSLPETGEYTISVVWLEDGPATYTLTITIPPLSGGGSGSCWVTNQDSLTAYMESSATAEVFGTAEAGMSAAALARTKDGWLGFDPGVAQAGNQGRARLRWYLPDWSKLTFDPPGCENGLPYLLSYDSIINGTYNALGMGNITLTNGSYVNEAFDPAGTGSSIHDTHMGSVAFGDMNADGTEDAVVSLRTNTGGTGTFVELALVLNTGGQPQHVTSATVGDRVPVRGLFIADGILTADLTIHDADDGLCCPSLEVTWQFEYQGGELVKIGE
ncbi:MAG: hypothetical protein JXB30_15605 [Anaerolineae bacterium]|nr:hypothetical protein [Anaerolineae bacterium]